MNYSVKKWQRKKKERKRKEKNDKHMIRQKGAKFLRCVTVFLDETE